MTGNPGQAVVLERCLFLLVAVGPLVYAPGLVSAYRLPKQTAFALGAAVVLWGAVVGLRRAGLGRLPLFLPIAAYATVTVLSILVARNRYEALVQAAQTVTSLGLFWVAATALTSTSTVLRLFHWMSVGAVVVALIGITQAWALEIPTLVAIGGWGSTYGNPNMAAQYLVLALPPTVALFLLTTDRRPAWLRGAAVALVATHLGYTGTRAAWGAVVLATVVVLAGLWARRATPVMALVQAKRWGFVAILATVLVMNVVPRLWVPDWGRSRAFVGARLVSLAGEAEAVSSLGIRLAIWTNTMVMVADHPLLGVGKGNFQFEYPRYARRAVTTVGMRPETRIREAHNDYVQVLAETGVFGLLALAWILLCIVRRVGAGGGAVADAGRGLVAAACAFALLALLAEAFFDFPFQRAAPEMLFWLLAGVLWRTSAPSEAEATVAGRPRLAAVALGVVAGVATLAAAWGANAVRADYHYARGGRAYFTGRLEEAGRELPRAVALNPFDERYRFLLALHQTRTGEYDAATRNMLRVLAVNPYHVSSWNNLAVALASQGRSREAIEALETSLSIWPDHVEARNNLGLLYASVGRPDLAIVQFREVLVLQPRNAQARARLDALTGGSSAAPGGVR